MMRLALIIGKLVSGVSRTLGLGAGATWSGEIALTFSPNILQALAKTVSRGIIIVAGTNGKTTTALMIKQILEHQGLKVVHNGSGANLLNGVVSAFIEKASWRGKVAADWGVFEVDENSLPLILIYINPKVVVLLNLFRDQLDRYGEVDVIATKWQQALGILPQATTVIVNSDDPGVAHLGKNLKAKALYFGLNEKKYFLTGLEHATDSTFCLNCGGRLTYKGIYYSHLGLWRCDQCGEKRPVPHLSRWQSPLTGLYNQYNTLAAAAASREVGIGDAQITKALRNFRPAFGRQEEFVIEGKKVKIFLSKNPAGFNASLRTVLELGAKHLLLVLNDRIPDGRDVSWIWDVDFETIPKDINISVSGDRVYDMALRIKYAGGREKLMTEPDLKKSIHVGLNHLKPKETLYVLPTYSAMLEVRKILTGRKIR